MSDSVRYFERFYSSIFPNSSIYNLEEKERNVSDLILYMLNRTQSMFKWENLPETISERILEFYLQINGNCCFYKHEENVYVFTGGLGGEPDVYFRPTIYTIANPALNISKNLKIGEDCEIVLNDSCLIGLIPLFRKYASEIAETELSLQLAVINSRIIDLIACKDDKSAKSAQIFLENVKKGKMGILADNALFDSVKTQPYGNESNSNNLTNIIEVLQYYKASWFNELGLNSNFNMKREALNSSESQLNKDSLLPLIDNMLECRKKGIEKVNKTFNLEISVEFNSSWEDNAEEIEKQLENKDSEGVLTDQNKQEDKNE